MTHRKVFERLALASLARASIVAPALLLAACGSNEVVIRQAAAPDNARKPARILVRDFAVAPADIAADAPVGARLASVSGSPELSDVGRQLGLDMAAQLIAAIREMGLPAERAWPQTAVQANDVVIQGYLAAVHEDNPAQRFSIGLEFAPSECAAVVETFQITPQGFGRRLVSEGGASTVPAGFIMSSKTQISSQENYRAKIESWSKQSVKEISGRLAAAFQQQGWVH